jgi:hypothetical protein
MSTAPLIENRRDLFDHFDHVISGTYDDLRERQELDYGQNMLKTFLIESNIDAEELPEYIDVKDSREIDYSLHEIIIENGNDTLRFYLDSENPRFWSFYTLEESRTAKSVVGSMMTGVSNGLDYPWFPVELVKEVTDMGEFRGINVSFKPDKVFSEEYVEDKLEFGDLSVQGSGFGTKRLYDILSDQNDLKSYLALSAVGIKRELNDTFILERITSNGRFTTRGGNSIHLHRDTLSEIRDRYADRLERIETHHRITYPRGEHGTRIEGSPLIIDLKNEIDDIPQFIDGIVSAKDPFRLWGGTTQLDTEYYKFKGIDLHNNDKVTMEIAPSWIRLYLGEGACGNTALRIYSNLQRYYDSEAKMEVHE